MQILIQWLSKIAHESPKLANSSRVNKLQGGKDQNVKSKEMVAFSDCGIRRRHLKRVELSKLNCDNLSLFYFLRRKDVSKSCFYHTLNLKGLRSFHRRQNSAHPMKMKEEVTAGLKPDSSANVVGNKVLPVTDTARSLSAKNDDQCTNADKKEKGKGDKMKTISKMKELLKWAAAAKAEEGGKHIRKVLHFRNRAALKAVPDDDQTSDDSPKMSCKYDVDSCSTITCVYSAVSAVASSLRHDQILDADPINSTPSNVRDQSVARSGNWITTDSEFVVLEL